MGHSTGGPGWGAKAIALVLALTGLVLAGGGLYLLALGGSAYYLMAGLGCLVSAYLYQIGQRGGLAVFLLVFLGTVAWALWEVGFDFWLLVPRVLGPLVLTVLFLLHDLARHRGRQAVRVPAVLAVIAGVILLFGMRGLPATVGGDGPSGPHTPGAGTDWQAYGQSPGGLRFAAVDQITPANVGRLKLAWVYRTGDGQRPGEKVSPAFQATPLKVGDTLYLCTGRNRVIALDADTGKPRWTFDPKLDMSQTVLLNCRGVSYYEAPAGTKDCPRRIITGTLDARLIAIDAQTGRPCPSFGANGQSGLKDRLGEVFPGAYSVTSPPVVVNDMIVVNGFVLDGMTTDVPSGVIRGYDAVTGAFRWAWDAGALDENRVPAKGQVFNRDTPNSWSVMSADPELGLVFVPTGNATPDYVSMHRSPEGERYSTSIVALDTRTGKRRWNFQTVHHDIFDLDVPAQPVAFDWPMPGGGKVPAIAATTKQGYVFILDRRTGKPLLPVVEKPRPTGRIPGERYSPTQPHQLGFPAFIPAKLAEKDMWGATAFDQLWCRIRYRQLDYRGPFTPPSMQGSIQFPGNFGVLNWGSVSIDPGRDIMVVNSAYMPILTQLVERAESDKRLSKEGFHPGFVPQKGTPYGVATPPFLSPIGLPCNAPPWGKLSAIDLKTRKILWTTKLGSSADQAPLGIAVPGIFNIGGAVTTAGGVTFIGSTIDSDLRAFDTANGHELWRYAMPAGGQATPMSYRSGKTGRQMVVIAAGGHGLLQVKTGDYVMAFALPD